MKNELLNNTLTPPSISGSEGEEQEQIERLLEWVRLTFLPEQVFPTGTLMDWAERNDYVLI